MAAQVFDLEAATDRWQGPIASDHGQHLVLITEKTGGHAAELADIVELVRADLRAARLRENREAAIDRIVEAYDVRYIIDNTPGPIE